MTSAGVAIAHPTSYRCPECGASIEGGAVTVTVETDLEPVIEMVEAWPGGPLVEDHGVLSRSMKPGKRWFSTNLCADRFDLSIWNYTLLRYDDGRPDLIRLEPAKSARAIGGRP